MQNVTLTPPSRSIILFSHKAFYYRPLATCNLKFSAPQGRHHGRLGEGNSPTTPHKGHFCKSSKTDEKILGVWGGDDTN